jgi:hypothetical protein
MLIVVFYAWISHCRAALPAIFDNNDIQQYGYIRLLGANKLCTILLSVVCKPRRPIYLWSKLYRDQHQDPPGKIDSFLAFRASYC